MKKHLFVIVLLVLALCVRATELESEKLQTIVSNKLSATIEGLIIEQVESDNHHLDTGRSFDDEFFIGYINFSPMNVVDSTMVQGVAVEMLIEVDGIAVTYDWDFGDPVSDYEFSCLALLEKKELEWIVTSEDCELL